MLENYHKKYLFAAIGSLIFAASFIFTVLCEYIFLGVLDDFIINLIVQILIAVSIILIGIGTYKYYSEINKKIAWGLYFLSLVTSMFLLSYHILRLINLAENYLYTYLGYVHDNFDLLANIYGLIYAENNLFNHIIYGIYNFLLSGFFILFSINPITQRANRKNEKLSLISGLGTLVAIILFVVFFGLYINARLDQLSTSLLKSKLSFTGIEVPIPILGNIPLSWVFTGLDFLFIGPAVSDLKDLFLLAGFIPLAIFCILNGYMFFKESKIA